MRFANLLSRAAPLVARGMVSAAAVMAQVVSQPAPATKPRLPAASTASLRSDFANPPFSCQSRPLWFWNGPLDGERTRATLAACKERGYCGVGILPAHGMSPGFMTPGFLAHYRLAVEQAASLGLKLCLYDEYWFPSGSAGGLLAQRFPEALSQRLDLLAWNVTGPKLFAQVLPAGTFMGAVAMNLATKQRADISRQVKDGQLIWQAPAGEWRVMAFTCVRDGAGGLVDYLNPEAVQRFISLTYQAYYETFPDHFGATIDSAFYDEPTFHWVQGGRAWTAGFNERFRRKHRFSPVALYPALWFDIGPETAAARNALFGFRAELFATGFPKTLNEWCRAHRLQLTGHVDQEEVVNPVGLCGDLMKAFKHQDIPAIDQVFQYGRASRAYKLVSSAAQNYDRPLVLTECYGGINNLPVANLYKEAMDQFAKGINVMVPHAVWYTPTNVIFQPDLSPTNAVYGPRLPAFNQYIGRLQRLLQGGRHVADIAVLYPIATLQAGYYFGPGKPYEGGVIPPEADYMEVGERLALALRRDFTFIHPEVLDERCRVAGAELRLANRVNWERFRVFVIPGSRAIHWSNLRKLKNFYERGGKLIATTRLPEASAEFGQDERVCQAVATVFGTASDRAAQLAQGAAYTVHTNANGGKAFFAPQPRAEVLKAVLGEALPVGDVAIEGVPSLSGGNLSYMHRVAHGRDVYFFGNSSDTPVDAPVRLRGRLKPEWWNPHTGEIAPCEHSVTSEAGGEVTSVRLRLGPVQSVFLVAGLAEAEP